MAFLLQVLIGGIAIWFTTLILPGLTIVGADSPIETVWIVFLVALVFAIVNAVIKPILHVLAFPLYVLTLGFFLLVVNALLLMLTAWITEQTSWGIRIDNFGTALLAALIISVVSFVLSVAVPGRHRDAAGSARTAS